MGALTLVAPRTEHDAITGRKLYEWVKRKRPDAVLDLTSERVTLRFSFTGEDDLTLGLDTMTAWNVRQMQRSKFVDLYSSGVRYEREILCNHNGVVGICEEWWTSSVLYARKSGDCEDLSCTLAAQLITRGETKARARARRSKRWLAHPSQTRRRHNRRPLSQARNARSMKQQAIVYLAAAAGIGVVAAAMNRGRAAAVAPLPAASSSPTKYTPEQAAKALRVYVTQASAVDWGSPAAPNPIIKAAQADMKQIAADGIYGPATQKRGAALTGNAWPSRPATKVTVKKPAAASIPANKVTVTTGTPKPTPPPGAATDRRDPPPEVVITQRTTKQAAQALYNYVTPIIRSGRGAELGSAAKPNDTVAAAQRDMKLVASDGIYGPKTQARGKELLGMEFPSRYGIGTKLPAANVLNKPPAAPPITTTNEQARAAESLLAYLSQPGANQGVKGSPSVFVKASQAAMGQLTADGIYGPATRARGAQLTGKTFPPRK